MLTRERFELYESPKEHLLCIYAYDISKETRDKIAALLLNDVSIPEIPETGSGLEAHYDGVKDISTMQKVEPEAHKASVTEQDSSDRPDPVAYSDHTISPFCNELPFAEPEDSVSDVKASDVRSATEDTAGPAMIDTETETEDKDYSNASVEEITTDFNAAPTEDIQAVNMPAENSEIIALKNSNMRMMQAAAEGNAAEQNAVWSDIVAWINEHQNVQDVGFMKDALLSGINITFYPVFHQMIGDSPREDYINRAVYMINTATDEQIKSWYAAGIACFRNQHLI